MAMIQLQPQPTYPVTEAEKVQIRELRERCKDVLTEFYDTDFNLLRWILGWKHDLDVVEPKLRKHLLMRKLLNFDVPDDQLPMSPILDKYFKEMWVNRATGKTDSVTAILMDGRADPEGLTKTVAYNDFALSRLCYTELEMRRIMRLEAKHNRRFTLTVLIDAEGSTLNSWTWTAVKDAYMHAMPLVFQNYVEIVDLLLIINAGRLAYMVWKVFDAVVPQSTASKVKILSSNWKTEIFKYFTPENLPVFWGGTHTEDSDRYAYEFSKIPEELYYNSDRDVITPKMLTHVTIGPGASYVVTISKLNVSGSSIKPFKFQFHFKADSVIVFTAYYSENEMTHDDVLKEHSHSGAASENPSATNLDQIYPLMYLCRNKFIPDKGFVPPQTRSGYYYFVVKNESWLFSRAVDYFIEAVE